MLVDRNGEARDRLEDEMDGVKVEVAGVKERVAGLEGELREGLHTLGEQQAQGMRRLERSWPRRRPGRAAGVLLPQRLPQARRRGRDHRRGGATPTW